MRAEWKGELKQRTEQHIDRLNRGRVVFKWSYKTDEASVARPLSCYFGSDPLASYLRWFQPLELVGQSLPPACLAAAVSETDGRMHRWFHRFRMGSRSVAGFRSVRAKLRRIKARCAELRESSDAELKAAGEGASDAIEDIAATVEVARRTIGLEMFDVQIRGALAMAGGKIAELQTGEGKTLAAVPAIAWHAKSGNGVHVMTANDYLAKRDSQWMRPIYNFLGLTVGCIQGGMTPEQRRQAYACHLTYCTPQEVGFDFLRDQLAMQPCEQVLRPFAAAVIDEADSILIDEARIPLVIAGGKSAQDALAGPVNEITRGLHPTLHYAIDEHGHNVALTDEGIAMVEKAFGCGNLFDNANLPLHTAVQDSLHAHALLHRDVDYLVKDRAIQPIDEFKGRIAKDRRWPAGLQTAIEAKERVSAKTQGRVLGSITLQSLIALFPKLCGMTGTAATQSEEFASVYGLDVEVIPTHRPSIRVDHPDVVFASKREKEHAVVDEIRRVHRVGRPVLLGTASVQESKSVSARLSGLPHEVLNASNDEQEAAIIARAGQAGAVTISTNMAGRGVDIRLGDGVRDLGGLYVIGTSKHESRRIDNQLRGRAGRQGDPGSSRFFISREDDLLVKHGMNRTELQHDVESLQRVIEGHHLDVRQFLHKYEAVIEKQRQSIQQQRREVLTGTQPRKSEAERLATLAAIDSLWSDHLAAVSALREGIHWVSFGGRDPLHEYLRNVHQMFEELEDRLETEVARRLAGSSDGGSDGQQRGTTWTYLTTDEPFGAASHRIFAGLTRKVKSRSFWG
ncbi:MAG: accessory Sec system translocase SecA2 [Acidobacteriia bacterium]|nr:accessory Sec system translocase SecA2 [Terriglobia bacterium]MYG02355.1 accessory Sec system translocase SecA2 [Terriglobia bacterium]MYK12450.1 accessory Sec system translocase SecA2 [Terriglobia bacterium]